MPRFEPFAGLRYDSSRVEMADVIAPPYDVIDEHQRVLLEARSPYNAVRIELARDEPGRDRHTAAACRLRDWISEGVLAVDPEPAFYLYRMGWHDDAGQPRQTTGVIGALTLEPPGSGDVLPHERTMPKPLGDRLDLLRACRANLSPIWCLSPFAGLTELLEPSGPPVVRATDEEGVHHRLWRVNGVAAIAAVTAAVGSAPVVIADGHHRYQTALAYLDERRGGDDEIGADKVMALVVELAEDQLDVKPIHRIIRELPDGVLLPDAMEAMFQVTGFEMTGFDPGPGTEHLLARMTEMGAMGLLTAKGAWLLSPRNPADGSTEPDSALIAAALADLGPHQLDFDHSPAKVAGAVRNGEAVAAILLRPVRVAQIDEVARAGGRMPEKTTFFAPKPRTGLVFRTLSHP